MSANHGKTNLPDLIAEIGADFEFCARKAIEFLLNRPTLVREPFQFQLLTRNRSDIRYAVLAGNEGYRVEVALSLHSSNLAGLFPGEVDGEMKLDAIREMVNIMSGMLFSRHGFNSRFGYLRASIPLCALGDEQVAPACRISGVLIVESAEFKLDLTIKPTETRDSI